MEISHAVSDALLTLTGMFVFFTYLKPLNPAKRLLWSMFILSITAAAFFGVFRFLGYSQARVISDFFQHVAATAGASCLVAAAYLNLSEQSLSQTYVLSIVGVGLLGFFAIELSGQKALLQWASLLAIPLVLGLGVWGLIKGPTKPSLWLVLAVLMLIIATFNTSIDLQIPIHSIDRYHYLVAISLFCFGKAAKKV